MARLKKKYSNGQPRGGTPGKATDTAFGAKGNKHKSAHRYDKRPVSNRGDSE